MGTRSCHERPGGIKERTRRDEVTEKEMKNAKALNKHASGFQIVSPTLTQKDNETNFLACFDATES